MYFSARYIAAAVLGAAVIFVFASVTSFYSSVGIVGGSLLSAALLGSVLLGRLLLSTILATIQPVSRRFKGYIDMHVRRASVVVTPALDLESHEAVMLTCYNGAITVQNSRGSRSIQLSHVTRVAFDTTATAHQDLKPLNVMSLLLPEGEVLKFGLSDEATQPWHQLFSESSDSASGTHG